MHGSALRRRGRGLTAGRSVCVGLLAWLACAHQGCATRGVGQAVDVYGNVWLPADGHIGIELNRQGTVALCGIGPCKRIGKAVFCAMMPEYVIRRKRGTAACGPRRSTAAVGLCEAGSRSLCTSLSVETPLPAPPPPEEASGGD